MSKKGTSKDIQLCKLGPLDWTPEHARQSIEEIYRYVVCAATEAINWYEAAKIPKRRGARRLRVGAIIMVAVAGILPILSQIFGAKSSVVIQPAWAAVALAIAVTLVALDRFFGFSSAWARYMTTGQAITAALNQFRLDWQKSISQLPDSRRSRLDPPGLPLLRRRDGPGRHVSVNGLTQDSIDHLVDLAKTLVIETDRLIQSETSQWVKEFGETLTEIERSTGNQGKAH